MKHLIALTLAILTLMIVLMVQAQLAAKNRSWYAACNMRRGVGHALASEWFGEKRCTKRQAEEDRDQHIEANNGGHKGNAGVLGSTVSCKK